MRKDEMEQIRVDTDLDRGASTANPGVSEPSFVEALVNPVGVFRDPREVIDHPSFTHEEKRTILLSWARDELVIEQVTSKVIPELEPNSRIDAVIEALSQFDAPAAGEYLSAVTRIRATRKARGEQKWSNLSEVRP
jgi:hypothetical protein